MILITDLVSHRDSLQTLHTLGLLTHVNVDVVVDVQDETVAFVQGVCGSIHLVGKKN